MAEVEFHDRADEFRIVIKGRFSDASVGEVAGVCSTHLGERTRRLLAVDITQLTGYDKAGRKLLEELYHHGTTIAAGTPRALGFLYEISTGVGARPDMLRAAKSKPGSRKAAGSYGRASATG